MAAASELGKGGARVAPPPLTDDLPRSSVACHASLGGPSVAAHLQANDMLPLLQLALCEFPLMLLGFLHKSVGIATVVSIILGHGQAAQSHQGPLHRGQVFAFEEVNSLEHVSLGDAIVLSGL